MNQSLDARLTEVDGNDLAHVHRLSERTERFCRAARESARARVEQFLGLDTEGGEN